MPAGHCRARPGPAAVPGEAHRAVARRRPGHRGRGRPRGRMRGRLPMACRGGPRRPPAGPRRAGRSDAWSGRASAAPSRARGSWTWRQAAGTCWRRQPSHRSRPRRRRRGSRRAGRRVAGPAGAGRPGPVTSMTRSRCCCIRHRGYRIIVMAWTTEPSRRVLGPGAADDALLRLELDPHSAVRHRRGRAGDVVSRSVPFDGPSGAGLPRCAQASWKSSSALLPDAVRTLAVATAAERRWLAEPRCRWE